MSARHPISSFVDLARRLIAGGSAALVLLLVALAASPELHDRFHAADDLEHGDDCAVVLFASGVTLTTGVIAVPLPPIAWDEQTRPHVAKLFLVPSRYLRQPERGPPES